MKHLQEYRDPEGVRRIAQAIARVTTRPWNLMEVCGGQTHSILRFGLDQLLPAGVRLIHGPGCPVCVTPLELIDKAHAVATRENVTFCSFGDMLRVPGSSGDLLRLKSAGADVRIVYSPLDAVRLAQESPDRQVVFFAIGFETTAPANAMALLQAERMDLDNFSLLVSHVLVPPAIEAILSAPNNVVQGFLAAGHVCAVMGDQQYQPIAHRYRRPIVITGFEPIDLLQGIHACIQQLEEDRAEVDNQYARVVKKQGNLAALQQITRVFEITDRKWRGVGAIAASGWRLRDEYQRFDAERRFDLLDLAVDEPTECIAGQVLQGHKRPHECAAFGCECTPDNPLGAPMVSTEGACSAYFRYRRAKSPRPHFLSHPA